MEAVEIKESNKVIADFMGAILWTAMRGEVNTKMKMTVGRFPDNMYVCKIECLKYHSSWDWLMPVVKKIQQLQIEEFGKKKPVMSSLLDVDIESLYRSVVVFIQYYNPITK